MRRVWPLAVAAVVAVSPGPTAGAQAVTITGSVYLDLDRDGVRGAQDPPLPGVAVFWNTTHRAITDHSGTYSLAIPGRKGTVWVRKPASSSPGPAWRHLASDAKSGPVDFALSPGQLTTPLTFIVAADSHAGGIPGGDEVLGDILAQLTRFDPKPHFLTILGDISASAEPGQLAAVIHATSAHGISLVPVAGNHDWTDGGAAYVQSMGPPVYSFDTGEAHVIVLNSNDKDTAALKSFLALDMALTKPGQLTIALLHEPPPQAYSDALRGAGVAHLFSGHWHSNFTLARGGMTERSTQPLAGGGLDTTPGGYRVVKVDGNTLGVDHHSVVDRPLVTIVSPAFKHVGRDPVAIIASVEVGAASPEVTARINRGPERRLVRTSDWLYRLTLTAPASAALRGRVNTLEVSARVGTRLLAATTRTFMIDGDHVFRSTGGSWPQLQGGPTHQGAIKPELVPPLETVWIGAVDGHLLHGSPVVSGGRVVVTVTDLAGAARGGAVAFDLLTGRRLWRYVTGQSVRNAAAATSERVVLAANDGLIHALDASSGELLWKHDLGAGLDARERLLYGAPTIDRGVVYVSIRRRAAALSLEDGKPLWTVELPCPGISWLGSHAAVGVSEGIVVGAVTRGNDAVVAWRASDGAELWRVDGAGGVGVNTSPVIDGDTVFFGNSQADVAAHSLTTGQQRWSRSLSSKVEPYLQDLTSWGYGLTATPALASGALFVPTRFGHLHALNATTGDQLWSRDTGLSSIFPAAYQTRARAYCGSPAVTGRVLWIGSADGTLSALEVATGAELWKVSLGSPVLSGVVPAGSFLLVATYDGVIRALAPASDLVTRQELGVVTPVLVGGGEESSAGSDGSCGVAPAGVSDVHGGLWPLLLLLLVRLAAQRGRRRSGTRSPTPPPPSGGSTLERGTSTAPPSSPPRRCLPP